jgi:hypothetical protein
VARGRHCLKIYIYDINIMASPKRSSLELWFSSNPNVFVPTGAIYYTRRKAGQIPLDMTYDDWIKEQLEVSKSIVPLELVTLKFDPKAK